MSSDPSDRFLPYARQALDEEDLAAVVAVLRSDWLTQGPVGEAFEQALTATTGAGHAVACASGTAALHLAALALDLTPGDGVVVPAVTFLATANAVTLAGGTVVFADVDPDTGLLTAETMGEALMRGRAAGLRMRAVFPVHLAGQVAELEDAPARAGLMVVEDACHALGARRGVSGPASAGRGGSDGRPVGDGDPALMTAFSFHPVKTIACGEGGAITTGDRRLAERLRALRNHGVTRDPAAFQMPAQALAGDGSPNPWYYEMQALGLNYRLSDLHAALGLSQLRRLDRFVARRRELVAGYHARLAGFAPHLRPLALAAGGLPAWHLAVVLIDFEALGLERATVMHRLRAAGIGTQVHYIPIPDQPWYRQRCSSGAGGSSDFPGARRYYRRALSLPLFFGLTDCERDRVVEVLARTLGLAGSGRVRR